ncbi:hypothetical protein [Oceanobacillus sp. FSL K6-0251]|uniref:hypothetical protein n=1 Tax=Oceanobacillus sp. FSL K6-0251 TaxID=2921602 RepID=UPI0030FAABAB
MKKYGLILAITIVLIGFNTFQFIERSNLKNELIQKESELNEMAANNDTVYFEAGEVAEKFILSYFNYNHFPKKEDVKDYLSPAIINELNFSSSEEYEEEMSDINSSVNDLNIYLGDAVDGRQKVLGVFDNVLEIYDGESKVQSIIEMNLENNDDGWQIVDFSFFQY